MYKHIYMDSLGPRPKTNPSTDCFQYTGSNIDGGCGLGMRLIHAGWDLGTRPILNIQRLGVKITAIMGMLLDNHTFLRLQDYNYTKNAQDYLWCNLVWPASWYSLMISTTCHYNLEFPTLANTLWHILNISCIQAEQNEDGVCQVSINSVVHSSMAIFSVMI